MAFDFKVTLPKKWENHWREIQAVTKKYGFSLKKTGQHSKI